MNGLVTVFDPRRPGEAMEMAICERCVARLAFADHDRLLARIAELERELAAARMAERERVERFVTVHGEEFVRAVEAIKVLRVDLRRVENAARLTNQHEIRAYAQGCLDRTAEWEAP